MPSWPWSWAVREVEAGGRVVVTRDGRAVAQLVAQAMLEDLVLVSEDQAVRQYGVPTAW